MPDSINLTINLHNFDKAMRDFDKFEMLFQRAISNGIDELADRLETRLIQNLMKYNLGDSSIMSDINVVRVGLNGISISAGGEESFFVEYGTGIVGAESPHPHPETIGKYNGYDSQGHGESGWIYFKNGRYRWTMGQPAKPFVYDTWLYGSRIATQVITKHIRRITL